MRQTIYTLALVRAARVAGGSKRLAARLDLPVEAIELWMHGRLPTPGTVFLKVVDVLLERSLACLADQARAGATCRPPPQ